MAKTPAQRAKKHGNQGAGPAPGQGRVRGMENLPANPTTVRTPQSAEKNANLIIIAGGIAALLLFWYYHLLTLSQMTQLSGGLAMPDSRFTGYGVAEVAALQTAMNAEALGQLNYLHKTAGTLFPLIFAAVWLLVIGLNVADRRLRWTLWVLPLAFAVVDLWENVAIDAALATAPPEAGAVALASVLTVLRWVLLVLCVAAAGTSVLLGLRRSRRASRQ